MHASEAVAKQFQSSARRKRRYAAMDDVHDLGLAGRVIVVASCLGLRPGVPYQIGFAV